MVLINGASITTVFEPKDADRVMDQYYNLCAGNIDDNCLEISARNELDKLEHTLVPMKSILYVSCKEQA